MVPKPLVSNRWIPTAAATSRDTAETHPSHAQLLADQPYRLLELLV
jgi:hypothetical protein